MKIVTSVVKQYGTYLYRKCVKKLNHGAWFDLSGSRSRTPDMLSRVSRELMDLHRRAVEMSRAAKMYSAIAGTLKNAAKWQRTCDTRFLYNQSRHLVACVREKNCGDVPVEKKDEKENRIPEFRERYSFTVRSNATTIVAYRGCKIRQKMTLFRYTRFAAQAFRPEEFSVK